MTLEKLADEVGLSIVHLKNILNGNKPLSSNYAKNIIKCLVRYNAITTQGQVEELLVYIGGSFSLEDWNAEPLNKCTKKQATQQGNVTAIRDLYKILNLLEKDLLRIDGHISRLKKNNYSLMQEEIEYIRLLWQKAPQTLFEEVKRILPSENWINDAIRLSRDFDSAIAEGNLEEVIAIHSQLLNERVRVYLEKTERRIFQVLNNYDKIAGLVLEGIN